jgi:hypothetical protein
VLDFPASGQEAWSLYDRGGPRPEYLWPVLWTESAFNPAAVNSIGCRGINQACPFSIPTPPDYTSWAASQQLRVVVAPMYLAIVAQYGPLRSGTRAYQANFLPATLATAKTLDSVLARRGGAVYAANAGFDWERKGTITVGDLAHFVAKAADTGPVKDAIAQTYALRPGESPHDPVYGEDFPQAAPSSSSGARVAVVALAVVATVGAAAVGAELLRRYAIRHRWLAA